MAEPYPIPAEEEFDYVNDWRESLEATQPGGGGTFSATAQEETLAGYITSAKLPSALRYFLGYSYCDAESPYLLHREPPARHPRFPQLRCYTHSHSGIGVKATPSTPVYSTSAFTGWYGEELYYTPYVDEVTTLRYKSFGRTRFLPDEAMEGYDPPYAYEWLRYTDITIGPAVQALTADGSSNLVFREGSGPTQPTPGTTAFPAPIAELMAKSNMTVKWYGVPHEYLSDNQYYLYPQKIIDRLGRVNDADFIGLAKGCVLLLAVQFDPVLYPVIPADPDEPLTGWDVTFSFEHFDPDKGVPESEYRGHRVFPYRVDGKWYWATRENGNELLPLTAMYKIFQHIEDTS